MSPFIWLRNTSIINVIQIKLTVSFLFCFRMGDFREIDHDFFQSEYYIDDHGQEVFAYDPVYTSTDYQDM